jgi:SAM-dependent methyltransferase
MTRQGRLGLRPWRGCDVAMMIRTAERQAHFFLHHLHANMSLLDCGCGPGSITVGLAKLVAPAETVGIDINADNIHSAQMYAVEQKVPNVRFETADVYALPFPDASFDAVFSHALLEHLREPLKALKEMRRVLKPEGVIGVRVPDYEGNLIAPSDPLVIRSEELYERLSRHGGGNPRIGKHLRALLREAGFSLSECSASYDVIAAPEMSRTWGIWVAGQMASKTDLLVELGWTDREEIERISNAYKAWGEHPDAFNARAFCEAGRGFRSSYFSQPSGSIAGAGKGS